MTLVTSFVAELIRAANGSETLPPDQAKRLLDRAVTTIRDMRESVGIPEADADADALAEVQTTAMLAILGKARPPRIKQALLDAAGMIRDLRIVLDTGTVIKVANNDRQHED